MMFMASRRQEFFNTPDTLTGQAPTPSKKHPPSTLSKCCKPLLNPFFRVALFTPEDFVFDHCGETYGYAYRALPFL